MMLFTIKEKKQFGEYVLINKQGKSQSLMLEFYNMKEPAIGDKIYMDASLLNRNSVNFVQPYAFEPIRENETENISDKDIAGLHTKTEHIALKRIYG